MAIHVVNEARRCLHCKKPMCREGCPINTNIPEVIELFRTGHKEDAGAMLYANNPLSVICSLVCDHDKQCEGHCVLGRKGAPVHFSSIENYISDSYLDHLHLEMQPKTGQRVDKLFETIHFVDVQNGTRVPTGALNEMLARATAKVQPPSDKGKRLKVFYITQISTRPPTFVCFVNQKALFHFSYQRYLENQIRETFGLTGTPIKMITREHGDGAVKAGKV